MMKSLITLLMRQKTHKDERMRFLKTHNVRPFETKKVRSMNEPQRNNRRQNACLRMIEAYTAQQGRKGIKAMSEEENGER